MVRIQRSSPPNTVGRVISLHATVPTRQVREFAAQAVVTVQMDHAGPPQIPRMADRTCHTVQRRFQGRLYPVRVAEIGRQPIRNRVPTRSQSLCQLNKEGLRPPHRQINQRKSDVHRQRPSNS